MILPFKGSLEPLNTFLVLKVVVLEALKGAKADRNVLLSYLFNTFQILVF